MATTVVIGLLALALMSLVLIGFANMGANITVALVAGAVLLVIALLLFIWRKSVTSREKCRALPANSNLEQERATVQSQQASSSKKGPSLSLSEYGTRLGRKLALRYIKESKARQNEPSPVTLKNVMRDLDENLQESLIRSELGPEQWTLFAATITPREVLSQVKPAAIDAFVDLVSRWLSKNQNGPASQSLGEAHKRLLEREASTNNEAKSDGKAEERRRPLPGGFEQAGQSLGSTLARQYIVVSRASDGQGGQIEMDELLLDLEKDLHESFIRKNIGEDRWILFSESMSSNEILEEITPIVVDSFLDVASRWEIISSSNKVKTGSPQKLRKTDDASPPAPRMHLTPTEFEQYCVEWSIYLGYPDATVTRAVRDGGVDISSREMLAQCKYQELPVGVKPIRELYGLSQMRGKKPLFFALNGYTRDAISEADEFQMELWVVRPLEGTIERVGNVEQMNEGDYHSGPEGYSPNTAYPETQYGSVFDEEAEWNS